MTDTVYLKIATEIANGGMLCAGRVANIVHYLLQCSLLPGDMAEFGCHMGRTSVLMAHAVDKPLWLYDSFEGLPEREPQDESSLAHFKKGCLAVDESIVKTYFEGYGLREPNVYKAFFADIPKSALPAQICFAHLDGDLYTSIRDGIRLIYPRLVRGGVCIVDDYGWSGTAGVKIAVDEYLKPFPERARPLQTGNPRGFHAVIIKV